ncbi:MAG: hypothetical protein RML94_06475, partial [Bacteroidia bacterium]|nr:hypothetical protein [Bacteroidia bacterium]
MYLYRCLCYLFLIVHFFLLSSALATHIVGGDLTYVCLGDNRYRFRLEVFRDCSNSTVPFDNNITIAIYRLA